MWVLVFHLRVAFGQGGMYGVDIFFVLSGFLITGVLVGERRATGGIRLRRFYGRRVLRLYPALVFLCVALTPWAGKLVPGGWNDWGEVVLITLTYSMTIVMLFNPEWVTG